MEKFSFRFIFIIAIIARASGYSCVGRCNDRVDSSKSCQCNTACVTYNDCCSDYYAVCTGATCSGRCGTVDSSKPCQCNSQCTRYNDCCADYTNLCTSTGSSCQTLAQISQELWTNDVNRLSSSDVTVNFQTQVPDYSNEDKSSQRFFTYVNDAKLSGTTYTRFLALLDNYDPTRGNREVRTTQEQQEENAFLNSILATSVMGSLLKYLTCRGIVSSQADLRTRLQKMWLDFYPRSGSSTIPDTSGMEHVMVGEYKSTTEVTGFHNWLSFYQKEKAGQLNYYGYVKRTGTLVIGAAFNWNNRMKPLGSFFLNVSPEFDIAIYSLCYLTNPNSSCPLVLNGVSVTIMSYDKDGHIATAYPSV